MGYFLIGFNKGAVTGLYFSNLILVLKYGDYKWII